MKKHHLMPKNAPHRSQGGWHQCRSKDGSRWSRWICITRTDAGKTVESKLQRKILQAMISDITRVSHHMYCIFEIPCFMWTVGKSQREDCRIGLRIWMLTMVWMSISEIYFSIRGRRKSHSQQHEHSPNGDAKELKLQMKIFLLHFSIYNTISKNLLSTKMYLSMVCTSIFSSGERDSSASDAAAARKQRLLSPVRPALFDSFDCVW